MTDSDRSRTPLEWVSFGVTAAIVVAVVAAIGWIGLQPDDPADIEVRVTGEPRVSGELAYVEAEVRNRGDHTAEAVHVVAEVGDQEMGDQEIDFLSGGEVEQVVFVVERDDADRIAVRVASFSEP